jgi:hypothetical protein
MGGTGTVVRLQKFFGVSEKSKGPALVYALALMGEKLGSEVTFISFLPFLGWHAHVALFVQVSFLDVVFLT